MAQTNEGIYLDVYCKQRPDFSTYLPGIAEIVLMKNGGGDISKHCIYPIRGNHLLSFTAHLHSNKAHYQEDVLCRTDQSPEDDLGDIVEEIFTERPCIPVQFIDLLDERNGRLIADKSVLQLVREYPDIQKLFSDHPLFWSMLAFSSGEELYAVSVEISPQAVQATGLPYYLRFIRHLCVKYEGITVEEGTEKYGIPYLRRHSFGEERVSDLYLRKFSWTPKE